MHKLLFHVKALKYTFNGFTAGHRSKDRNSKLCSFMWGLAHMNTDMTEDENEQTGTGCSFSSDSSPQCERPIRARCLLLSPLEQIPSVLPHSPSEVEAICPFSLLP